MVNDLMKRAIILFIILLVWGGVGVGLPTLSITNLTPYKYIVGNYPIYGYTSNASIVYDPIITYISTNGGAYIVMGTNWSNQSQISYLLRSSEWDDGTNEFVIAAVDVSNQTNTYSFTNYLDSLEYTLVYGYSFGINGTNDTRKITVSLNTNIVKYKKNIVLRDYVIPSITPGSNGYWSISLLDTDNFEDTNSKYVFNFGGTSNYYRHVPRQDIVEWWELTE